MMDAQNQGTSQIEAVMQPNGATRAGVDMGDGILTINDQGAIESANAAAARMFGYSLDELTGRNLTALLPALGSDRFDCRLAPYLRPAAAAGKHRLEGRRKNGSPLVVEVVVGQV